MAYRPDKKKVESYIRKLYNPLKKRLLAKLKERRELLAFADLLTSSNLEWRKRPGKKIKESVLAKAKYRCVICGREYAEDDRIFDFHHVNGSPKETNGRNLVLVCVGCHRDIHRQVSKKLANDRKKYKERRQKMPWTEERHEALKKEEQREWKEFLKRFSRSSFF